MTERIIWTCDGCDEELVRKLGSTSDWKSYSLTLNNASGYPLCRPSGTIVVEGHLCPSCARHLAEVVDPRSWPRVVASPAVSAA